MNANEQAIGIAAKMYDARRTLKALCPSIFHDRCREWQDLIKKVAEGKGLSEMEAVVDILNRLNKFKYDSDMSVLWVLAAYVEMVEPSKEAQT